MPKLPMTTSSPSIGGRDPQIPDALLLWYCSDRIMIRRLEALHYRCLRYVDVELGRFHILVGPNASGKSTLFDAIAFLGDLVSDGLEAAVEKRTSNFQDLVWGRPRDGLGFELAVEFDIPDKLRALLPPEKDYRVFRYEVAIRETDGDIRIDSERGMLMPPPEPQPAIQHEMFPAPMPPPSSILIGGNRRGWRTILSKSTQAKDNFNIETSSKPGKGWATSIAFGHRRSALGNLPESPTNFPVSTYVKRVLGSSIKSSFLDSLRMREASSPARRGEGIAQDGSNLPWVIKRLKEEHPESYEEWLSHVQTTLSDLACVGVVERQDDRHAYLRLRYRSGVEIPSRMASDGALRLLALTLPAYLPASDAIYLLEEPENGIHPLAVDCVFESLSSVYESQVLLATHSPVVLRMAALEEALCFAKDPDGATDIVPGNLHPRLKDWRGSPNMDVLFATGVIG